MKFSHFWLQLGTHRLFDVPISIIRSTSGFFLKLGLWHKFTTKYKIWWFSKSGDSKITLQKNVTPSLVVWVDLPGERDVKNFWTQNINLYFLVNLHDRPNYKKKTEVDRIMDIGTSNSRCVPNRDQKFENKVLLVVV